MTQAFDFVRRAARLRALLLVAVATTLSACDAADRLTSAEDTAVETPATSTEIALASSFRGGIPIGFFNMPTSQFGSTYNGALRNIWPNELVKELSSIRARGGKVVLMFAGHERHYKSRGRFSLTKWKQRINRFRGTNFSQFIKDGTIIGHYLIDEPNDAHNWGRPVPGSMVEEMARYSKQLWPSMATVVRAEPGYLLKTGKRYRYLDAAWAQYVTRKGTPSAYIRRNVADARRAGLGLITGLNVTKGGRNGTKMSASLIRQAGLTLLSNSYPCAFISWTFEGRHASSRDVRSAMSVLKSRAQSRSTRGCRS